MASSRQPAASDMSQSEWATRCDLAALYRVIAHLRMTDIIYTHMTARIPGEEDTFLINSYGELFEEVVASSLVKMDMDGNVIGDQDSYNSAGLAIHSGVYRARPDVHCVMHTHTRAGIAISISKRGLLPVSQDAALVSDELGYHDYGMPMSLSEREAVGRDCKDANCVILRNHGLLTLGQNIPAAFVRMYVLEHACSAQSAAAALGDEMIEIAPEVLEEIKKDYVEYRSSPEFGQVEWQAMLRVLDRNGADYKR